MAHADVGADYRAPRPVGAAAVGAWPPRVPYGAGRAHESRRGLPSALRRRLARIYRRGRRDTVLLEKSTLRLQHQVHLVA